MDSFDVTSDGIMDLVIAREDGVVEVYVYDSVDQPYLKYTYVSINLKKNFLLFILEISLKNGNESVTSIQCGCVGTPGFDEIVVSTYSGKQN